jgi:asparagine N-glycosylation enzyme membrane subunit Stt3
MGEAVSEKELLEKRKENLLKFLKDKGNWIYYLILAFIVGLSVYIRTRNISKLKDITTGTWTLGPDLDPFLFLRWAKDIVEQGSLMKIDLMRYVPLGHDTSAEMKLLSYLIAWFHKFLETFSLSNDVTYSAIIFPVFFAAITAIAFFLFARKIFYKESEKTKNIIALVSTLLFVLMPSLLPRTIAGIPEKESVAFFFMFMAFYFFIKSFNSEKIRKGLIFGVLAGLMTGIMGLIWGGVTFVYLTIGGMVFFSFMIGKIEKNHIYYYGTWFLISIAVAMPFSTRYSLMNVFVSFTTELNIFMLLTLISHFYLVKKFNIKNKIKLGKLPSQISSLLLTLIFIILLSFIILGGEFITYQIRDVVGNTIHPVSITRFGLTVAENSQPYFVSSWKNEFGPILFGVPIIFWLFFTGTIAMFNRLIKSMRKKERIILTLSYLVFLFCLVFSKYAPHPNLLDGEGNLSLIIYFGGGLIFVLSFLYFYLKKYKEKTFDTFKEFNFSYILYFILLTMGIIGARGAVRLIMVLAAFVPISVSFLVVKTTQKAIEEKEETMKFVKWSLAIILICLVVFSGWKYYQSEIYLAENFAPGVYQWQWQNAMSWIRENTATTAVFAHWWDYGYWVQSIGERATVLDGGNAIVYWNYLMGRNVLTAINEKDSLEFLYTHNATHLLIDSTDIGKYTAFSSIGSDENYDRFSWIETFVVDDKQTQEETIYVYVGQGFVFDEDTIWRQDGKEILFPEKSAGVGAIIINFDKKNELKQPIAIVVYNKQQYNIPLKYAYYNNSLIDFGTGLDAGVFVFPRLDVVNNQAKIINNGALLYLSKRTIHSNLAQLYLFDKNSEYFKLKHTESNFVVKSLKESNMDAGEFVYYQGFQGPIKIWEINYPSGINSNEEYLKKIYPNSELEIAQSGKYSN